MTSEFGAGLIGALIGGLASIFGAHYQSKSADRNARETLAKASATTAYEVLGTLRELLVSKEFTDASPDHAAVDEWNKERTILVMRAQGAANLLPRSQEGRRKQVHRALNLMQNWGGNIPWSDYSAAANILISEARKQLGTFVQDEDEPPREDVAAKFTEELNRRRRMRLIRRLFDLEHAGEIRGLDEEEQEEAAEIQAELGVQHTRELSSSDYSQITS
ncbi:hypothetical protein [Streptomyces sp. 1222.5]|uniref:hypothetical protein n=1 Tax=Streptomyces sp. 1222.5 TaxID=1881026 RepID=UPI003D70A97D